MKPLHAEWMVTSKANLEARPVWIARYGNATPVVIGNEVQIDTRAPGLVVEAAIMVDTQAKWRAYEQGLVDEVAKSVVRAKTTKRKVRRRK